MRHDSTAAAVLFRCSSLGATAAPPPRLLQDPSLSATRIAFAFAGEIWTVPRDGGEASRLVSGQLRNRRPVFSPDGAAIAFTGTYDDNEDVYVVPAGGGPAEELPLPSGADACYSPDGTRLAYVPFPRWQPAWKKYRGGQTTPSWTADLSDSKVTKVPRENSNDRRPMWVGETVYFLSDRNGPVTLFAFDVKTGAVREIVRNPDGFDVQSTSAGAGAIVFDQFGDLKLLDLASGATKTVPVTITADLPQVRTLPRAALVARQPEDRAHRQADEPLGRRRREGDEGEGRFRPLRHAPLEPRPGLGARLALDRLRQAAPEPPPRRLRPLAGGEEVAAGDGRRERRPVAPVRPEREVSLLPRVDRRRPGAGMARHDEHEPARDEQPLRRCPAQGPPLASRPRERRGGSGREGREGRRRPSPRRTTWSTGTRTRPPSTSTGST